MGVADNQSYKNQYHFSDTPSSKEKSPSIETDPKINSTIKKNPFRSNVEIEGNEIVLQPDLAALFTAKGKRHSGGGMDVLLKPDSFIFSDYDELKISPKEHELFELKEGGTPAKTLKKNVDPKHYNTLVNILDNPFKDDLSKKSASKMLEKYISTLGNIAYIQEQKKGFPTGIPEFAMGTAPVYDKELKIDIDSEKQYMKAGGAVDNPKAQWGPISWMMNRGVRPTAPAPKTRQDRYIGQRPPYPDQWTNYYDKVQKIQYTAPDWITPKDFYATPGLVEYMKTLDKAKGVDWDMNKADDGWWGWRHEEARKKFYPNGKPVDAPIPDAPEPNVNNFNFSVPAPVVAKRPTLDSPKMPDIKGEAQGSKVASWQFTPWQKLSQGFNWGQYANVKKYMPFRSRYTATYVDPALVNPEQTIGDVKGVTNQQLSSLGTLNPILRNAQASQSFGQLLNQIPGIRSQYDNQNAQIINQSRQYNNQVKNNETMVNMGNDQQYYQQNVVGNQNYDNMKNYLANQAMSGTMRDVETNQKLAWNLLTQNNPAYNFNWKTGFADRTNKSIMDAQSTDPKSDLYTELATTIMSKIRSGKNPTPEEVNFMKSLAVGKLNFSPSAESMFGTQKKGGALKKRNPYK